MFGLMNIVFVCKIAEIYVYLSKSLIFFFSKLKHKNLFLTEFRNVTIIIQMLLKVGRPAAMYLKKKPWRLKLAASGVIKSFFIGKLSKTYF